mgnify:CR=1 FL=1
MTEVDYARARAFYEEGLQVADELGQKSEFAISLAINLAELAAERGNLMRFADSALVACETARSVGDKESITAALSCICVVVFCLKEKPKATAHLLGAVKRMRETRHSAFSASTRSAREPCRCDPRCSDQEVFAAAWARGKAMTIDEAVAYAR